MRAGTKPKLTPELQKTICQYLAGGMWFNQSCMLAGISPNSGTGWRQRGQGKLKDRPPTKLYVQFAKAVEKAEAEAEARSMARIRKAATGDTDQDQPSRVITKVEYASELHCQKCHAVASEKAVHCSSCGGSLERVRVPISEQVTRERVLPQWSADAWWLERKFPKRWGRRDRPDEEKPTDRLDEVLDVLQHAMKHQDEDGDQVDDSEDAAE